MADKKDLKDRELTCPFRDEIRGITELTKTVDTMAKQQNEMYNRLFVQNGINGGKDCLAVQIQKNTEYRLEIEESEQDERRNKWRRRSFYLSVATILISNIILLVKTFI